MLPINLLVLTEVAPQSSPKISLFRRTNHLVGTGLTQAGGDLRRSQVKAGSDNLSVQSVPELILSVLPTSTCNLPSQFMARGKNPKLRQGRSLGWILGTISSWKGFGCPGSGGFKGALSGEIQLPASFFA